jgi:hypothetical protein
LTIDFYRLILKLKIKDPLEVSRGEISDSLAIRINDRNASNLVFFSDELEVSLHQDYYEMWKLIPTLTLDNQLTRNADSAAENSRTAL